MQASKLVEDFLRSLWTSTQEISVLNLERGRNRVFIQPVQYGAHTIFFPTALQQLQLFRYSYMFVGQDSMSKTPSFYPLPSL